MFEARTIIDPGMECAEKAAFPWLSALSARRGGAASEDVSGTRSMRAEGMGGDTANSPVERPTVEEVIRQETDYIRRTLQGLRVPSAEIDDATQRVLLGVQRNLVNFDPALYPRPHEAIRAWLFRLCERAAVHVIRGLVRRREVPAEEIPPHLERDDSESPLDALELEETGRLLRALLAQIPPERAAALSAYYLEGIAVKEYAATLGISENTVWSRVHKGLIDLRAAHARRRAAESNSRRRPQ